MSVFPVTHLERVVNGTMTVITVAPTIELIEPVLMFRCNKMRFGRFLGSSPGLFRERDGRARYGA